MERKVFYKKHYSDDLSRLFLKDFIKSETSEIKDQNKPTNKKTDNYYEKPIRSIYWMTFTSNYLFVIILPFLIFLPLYNKDGRKASNLAGWFASLIMIGIFGAITTWIAYKIPIIWNNPIWNYVLNFLIHTIFWILIIKGNEKNKN
jgi:fatty acid desaturase